MSSPAAKPTLFALRIAPPRSARRLVGAGAVAVVVLLWWIATLGAGAENRFVSPVILPSPAEVIRSFPSLLRERALLQSIAATLRRVLVGFGLVALALPDIYNSLRHLFGLAFGYIMLAELINAQHGLGYLLMTSQRRGLSEHIILILLIIGALAYGIDRMLFWFQRGLFPHRAPED